jgi:hypothetical protein
MCNALEKSLKRIDYRSLIMLQFYSKNLEFVFYNIIINVVANAYGKNIR